MLQYLLIFLTLLLATASLGAEIYKWVDEKGIIHFSDKPPSDSKAKKVPLAPQSLKEVIEKPQQGPQRSGEQQQPQEVLATVALGFVPTVLATLPTPPIELTLVIKPQASGPEVRYKIEDPSPGWSLENLEKGKAAVSYHNFTLSLPPGAYEILSLEVRASSLSETPFSLATGGPSFTVPEGSCVYVGRIAFIFVRLPPGSLAQAISAVARMPKERGKSILMVYLPEGTLLLPPSTAVDTPGETEQTQSVEGSKQLLAKARAKNCTMRLARF